MFINLKDWRKLFSDTKSEEVVEKHEKKKSQDKCEYFFNGMVCVEHFEKNMLAKVTEEGYKKLRNFTLGELFIYFSGFLDSHQIDSVYDLSGCGPVNKTSEFLAFKSFIGCIFDLLKEHMKVEEGDKDERSDSEELCPQK